MSHKWWTEWIIMYCIIMTNIQRYKFWIINTHKKDKTFLYQLTLTSAVTESLTRIANMQKSIITVENALYNNIGPRDLATWLHTRVICSYTINYDMIVHNSYHTFTSIHLNLSLCFQRTLRVANSHRHMKSTQHQPLPWYCLCKYQHTCNIR